MPSAKNNRYCLLATAFKKDLKQKWKVNNNKEEEKYSNNNNEFVDCN